MFIDDRADFYGEQFYQQYAAVSQTLPGYLKVLDAHYINWIIFPANSRIVFALKENPDWHIEAEDKASCLMLRNKPIEPPTHTDNK